MKKTLMTAVLIGSTFLMTACGGFKHGERVEVYGYDVHEAGLVKHVLAMPEYGASTGNSDGDIAGASRPVCRTILNVLVQDRPAIKATVAIYYSDEDCKK